MSVVQLSEARLLTADQFAQISRDLSNRTRAVSEAETILDKAKHQAEQIVQQAQQAAAEQEKRLSDISSESLKRFLDQDALDMTARALRQILEQARDIHDDFQNAAQWVTPVIRTAFSRIIGTMPKEDVLAGAIAQSLNEVRDRWDLVLRCHPSLQDQLAQIVKEDSRLSAAIREVQVDRALTVEECRLVSATGILDIGVDAQLETFLQAVEDFLTEDRND